MIGLIEFEVGGQAMQMSFSELEYAAKKKVTRRDRFLGDIVRMV
ncbi:MAG: hypothetical protein QXS54_07965 [Candidatus Methanomethylicaceae archaeon]